METEIGMAKSQPEFILQKMIAQYLRTAYPHVKFVSVNIGKLSMPQAVRNKAIQCDGFACPDMLVFDKRTGHKIALELKAASPYTKDGSFKRDRKTPRGTYHIDEQNEACLYLQGCGFMTAFVWEFNQARALIDGHLRESNQQFAARLRKERNGGRPISAEIAVED